MSYILDALRRADAERERGAVPNIHAQPYAGPSGETDVPRTTTPPWAWVAMGLLVALLAGFAWKLLAGDAAPPTPKANPTVAVAPAAPPATTPTPPPSPAPAPAATPSVAPAPTPSTERPVTLPAASLDLPTPIKPPPRAAASAAALPDKKAAAPRAETKTASPAANQASATGAAAPSAAAASTPAERIYKVSELPDDVRRALPSLPIGGAMHSPTPANRMLIVNGQVFHEGDVIAPELTLEQIRLKSAVLRFRNYRYEISY